MLKSRFHLSFIAFFMLLFFSAIAQSNVYQDPGYDTLYIESFRDKLVVTLVSAANTNTISVIDSTGNEVAFSTNLPMSFGLALDYKWITVEYTTSFGRSGPEQFGYTSMRNIGFGLTGRKFWFRNFYQNTKGYYLSNPEYFYPEFNPAVDIYPHRDDITSSVYFANINYGFNHRRYSNMASLWQIEKQKKSAGSFTAGLSFAYSTYNSDSALVPKKYQDLFASKEFITGYYFTMLGVNGGYLHTFSFGKNHGLFVSLALIPGLSYQSGKAFSEEGQLSPREGHIGGHLEGRIVTGFNGERWYTTMSYVGYVISSNFEDRNPFDQGYGFFRFVVGFKLTMPEAKSSLLKKIGL